MGKLLQSYKQLECKIFGILLEHLCLHFSNLHDCTFKWLTRVLISAVLNMVQT